MTRSGHPILFPFPGRLREGRLTFEGKTYQLPLNEGTKKHAIHGFTPRNPWRVTDDNGDEEWAFVRGEFNLRKDLPAAVGLWPSEFNLAITLALEHFAACISDQLLKDPRYLAGADEEAADLWRWHATEEIEHKDTALAAGAEEAPAYTALTSAIKAGSRLAIWLSTRI